MKKRGFTLIELIVCFALITIVSLSIFKTVLSMQEKQIKNTTYNSYLSFVSVLNNTIQNDFLTDTISNVTSCGANCFDITYLKKGIVRLEADKENNTISYGGSVEKLPDNYEFYKDISFNNYASVTTSTLDSYYLLRLPIKSDLFPNMDDVKYMHQYSSNVSRENKYILRLDLDGGTIDNMNENILYVPNTIVNLPTPTKEDFTFVGWEKISGNGVLSGNTLTMGTNNTVVKAKFIIS